MKNISIVLNIVLLVAVAILYFLHFSTNKPTPAKATSMPDKLNEQNIAIAYVNSDSLIKNYKYFENIKKQLEEDRMKLESEYGAQAKGLENEIAAFQKNAPTMTQSEAQAKEENLMMKRQRLMQYQERLSQQMGQKEMQLNDSLYNKITQYLREYSKDNNLDLVFGYSKGAGLLYAHDSLEVTKTVLKGLNEQYDNNKTSIK